MKHPKKNNKKIRLNTKKFSLFLTIVFLLTLTLILALSNSAIGKQENIYKTVVIKNGDTIWKIAENNNSYDNMEEYVDKIYKVNKLNSGGVYPGQKILIPIY